MTLCHLILLFHAILVAIGTFFSGTIPQLNQLRQGLPSPKLRVSLRSRRRRLHQGMRLQPAIHLCQKGTPERQFPQAKKKSLFGLLVKVWGIFVPKVCWNEPKRLMGVFLAEHSRSWFFFCQKNGKKAPYKDISFGFHSVPMASSIHQRMDSRSILSFSMVSKPNWDFPTPWYDPSVSQRPCPGLKYRQGNGKRF